VTHAHDRQAIEAEVREADRRRYAAMIDNDLDSLDRMLGEHLVYTHSDARSDDKAAYMAGLRAGAVRYLAARPEDVRISIYGDTAVLSGRVTLVTSRAGVERTLDNLFLSVWVKQGSAWRMVAWASTPRR
jgi:hypothetical protein